MTDPENDSTLILKLELLKEEANYWLINSIHAQNHLSRHLAKDSYCLPYEDSAEQIKYHIVCTEYCPNHDLLTYSCNVEEKKRIDQALDLTNKVATFANDFSKAKVAYTDIKASNFLLRDDGTIFTGDLKSIVPINDKGYFPQVLMASAAYEPAYVPPIHAEQYMTFKVGLMLYELIVAPDYVDSKENDKPWLDRAKDLDFDLDVFKSEQGKTVKLLIEKAMNPDPQKRPSLEEVIAECKDLQKSLISYKEEAPMEEKVERREMRMNQ
jgi:serine/threonine protein kinase